MQTRSGTRYPKPESRPAKRRRVTPSSPPAAVDYFDGLHDDLVLFILSKLSSSAESPSDLVSILMTCKRMNGLGLNQIVLSRASAKSLAIKAKSWSKSAHSFFKRCVDAGSLEASYALGMIKFYCLESRSAGAALMAKAAIGSHAAALYSLAIIQFNGSGGSKSDKDLRAGVALCARSAFLGHVDALRELGHCLQDGYGVRRHVAEGRRFLLEANARELAGTVTCQGEEVNRFMVEWFEARAKKGKEEELRMCSHVRCGRPETRRHEFRRCSVCGTVNYCSRACQALHWRLAHKSECVPMERWADVAVEGDDVAAGGGDLI